MTASWWRQESPIGVLTVLAGDFGVQRIELGSADLDVDALDAVDAVEARDDEVAIEVDEYFDGRRRRFTMPVDLSTVEAPFPRAVYEALCRDVRFGETVSYGELAQMAGRPGAARAVGNAMSRNPVPIVVPCHRVVASGGRIGGYGPSGVPTKRFLLALEGIELPA
ncbi:MAG TPA: methylated-DNA--[protein]-cysteine S-methyltransferase [Acidimicrobiia bacterium]